MFTIKKKLTPGFLRREGFKMNDCLCLKLFIYFVIMLKTNNKKIPFFELKCLNVYPIFITSRFKKCTNI